jgi:hypothetical protein
MPPTLQWQNPTPPCIVPMNHKRASRGRVVHGRQEYVRKPGLSIVFSAPFSSVMVVEIWQRASCAGAGSPAMYGTFLGQLAIVEHAPSSAPAAEDCHDASSRTGLRFAACAGKRLAGVVLRVSDLDVMRRSGSRPQR